jgi:hypothetical protein
VLSSTNTVLQTRLGRGSALSFHGTDKTLTPHVAPVGSGSGLTRVARTLSLVPALGEDPQKLASLNLDEYGTELIHDQHEAAQVTIAIPRALLVLCALSFCVLDGRFMWHSSTKDAHPCSSLGRVSIIVLAYL